MDTLDNVTIQPAADEAVEKAPESVRVHQWRVDEFVRMGYDADTARWLADGGAMLDMRYVEALLENGCSHELAARIVT